MTANQPFSSWPDAFEYPSFLHNNRIWIGLRQKWPTFQTLTTCAVARPNRKFDAAIYPSIGNVDTDSRSSEEDGSPTTTVTPANMVTASMNAGSQIVGRGSRIVTHRPSIDAATATSSPGLAANEDHKLLAICPLFPTCTSTNQRDQDLRRHVQRTHLNYRGSEKKYVRKTKTQINNELVAFAKTLSIDPAEEPTGPTCANCGGPSPGRVLTKGLCQPCDNYTRVHGRQRPRTLFVVTAAKKKIERFYKSKTTAPVQPSGNKRPGGGQTTQGGRPLKKQKVNK